MLGDGDDQGYKRAHHGFDGTCDALLIFHLEGYLGPSLAAA